MLLEPVSTLDFALLALAALAAGAVNALAGGGTLVTFPNPGCRRRATGVGQHHQYGRPGTGYLGATMAQAKDLAGQRCHRLRLLVLTGALGGIVGGFLLLQTDDRVFRILVPYLILLASGLLAFQDRLRRWVAKRSSGSGSHPPQ